MLVGLLAPGPASALSNAAAPSAVAELSAISSDLRDYRARTAAQQQEYRTRLGSRFSVADQERMRAASQESQRELAALQQEVDRALRLARQGAERGRVRLATEQAARTVDRLTDRAAGTQADVSALLQSRVSLIEALTAWQDYSRSLSQLAAFGDRLDSVARSLGSTG